MGFGGFVREIFAVKVGLGFGVGRVYFEGHFLLFGIEVFCLAAKVFVNVDVGRVNYRGVQVEVLRLRVVEARVHASGI